MHGAGCAAGCLLRAGAEEGGWPGCRWTLLTTVFHTHKPSNPNHGNQSKLQSMPWATLLLPGLWQEPPWCFLRHRMQQDAEASAPEYKYCLHRHFGHLSPTSSTTMSFPCPPPPPLPFLQEGKKAKRWLHTRSHPPDARTRRGLTDPPQGAPREMKPPMY